MTSEEQLAKENPPVSIGGLSCKATGNFSATIGGVYNRAINNNSLCIGGEENFASGDKGTIVGGTGNVASGESSLVIGCQECEAAGRKACAVACRQTVVNNNFSAAIGGTHHTKLECCTGDSYVSICGCGTKDAAQSTMVAISQTDLEGKVYVKGVGGWSGDAETLEASEDLACVIASLVKEVKQLKTEIRELKTSKNTKEQQPKIHTATREEQYDSVKDLLIPNIEELSEKLDE